MRKDYLYDGRTKISRFSSGSYIFVVKEFFELFPLKNDSNRKFGIVVLSYLYKQGFTFSLTVYLKGSCSNN